MKTLFPLKIKLERNHICKHSFLHFISQHIPFSQMHRNDWLIETNRFLIGEFIFILSIDWMLKKQVDIN